MTPQPTASSFAVLGLLGVQPWTAYELVAQSKRSLHWFWPRSERHLYAELKRLVERGHAEAHVEGGRRRRTRYTITPAGRAALQAWLGTEPAPPTLEIEGLLRVMLADQGNMDDLRAAVEATARQARTVRAEGLPLVAELLATGGPFPQRLHLNERLVSFYSGFNNLLLRWCEETLADVETWQGTQDIGLTPSGRQRLVRAISEHP
ncbi:MULTISPECIES: PadR family transcriptional regulator [Mycobacterium]|uniref:PadR family transcriptional regulator n=1 Tax=Mycobacterium TaxID=1763 RepID=UPI000567A2DC|nr:MULTISPECIES: PadR family transcriptional regulator [Mycobacterium]MBC9863548.1 Transcriptional regulator, PadR family [Mycobacterium pseudoshottsii]RFZ71243.1 Transcriptional regulator PadR-like family protein [Mycobacterium marinum]